MLGGKLPRDRAILIKPATLEQRTPDAENKPVIAGLIAFVFLP
jgi:hypothetical protein